PPTVEPAGSSRAARSIHPALRYSPARFFVGIPAGRGVSRGSHVWPCRGSVTPIGTGWGVSIRTTETRRRRRTVSVKSTRTTAKGMIGGAAIAAASVFAATPASAATPNVQGFGTSEELISGPMITTYTVSNLEPSSLSIPGYMAKGTLYQADITA